MPYRPRFHWCDWDDRVKLPFGSTIQTADQTALIRMPESHIWIWSIDAAFLYPSLGVFAGRSKIRSSPPRRVACIIGGYLITASRFLISRSGWPCYPCNQWSYRSKRYAMPATGSAWARVFCALTGITTACWAIPITIPSGLRRRIATLVSVHKGTGGMPSIGVDPLQSHSAKHMISHPTEMILACVSVICGGACERFQKVRIGFLEPAGGWIAPEWIVWIDTLTLARRSTTLR